MSTSEHPPLSIPQSVWEALALPEGRKEQEVRRELAVALYREDMLSFGKARQLAGESKRGFAHLLGRRGVVRHYGEQELEEDLAFARGARRNAVDVVGRWPGCLAPTSWATE
jgi:predicted HTH domain antitoxin